MHAGLEKLDPAKSNVLSGRQACWQAPSLFSVAEKLLGSAVLGSMQSILYILLSCFGRWVQKRWDSVVLPCDETGGGGEVLYKWDGKEISSFTLESPLFTREGGISQPLKKNWTIYHLHANAISHLKVVLVCRSGDCKWVFPGCCWIGKKTDRSLQAASLLRPWWAFLLVNLSRQPVDSPWILSQFFFLHSLNITWTLSESC